MTRTIGVVVFEGAEELDFVGPWEVFTMLQKVEPETCEAFLVSERGREVRCAKGMRVLADYSFADAPQADVIVIPGGQGTRTEDKNPVILEFLRKQAKQAELMTSVCTGAFLLQAIGLLEGKKATTHWGSIERLGERGVEVVEFTRFVDEGAVITAAGVSAGIDMSLHIVGRLWSPELARKVQKAMEYFPEPPYGDVPIRW